MLPDGKIHWLDVSNRRTKDGKSYITVKIGNECQGGQPVYSAAHKPFPAQTEHDRAKANGFQELDSDVPF